MITVHFHIDDILVEFFFIQFCAFVDPKSFMNVYNQSYTIRKNRLVSLSFYYIRKFSFTLNNSFYLYWRLFLSHTIQTHF